MKKRFILKDEKKNPQRLLDSIVNEIRKYIKREKRKPLPEGYDFWKLDCKFAQNEEEPKEIRFEDVINTIHIASKENCESFYIELIAHKAKKKPKVVEENLEEDIVNITEEFTDELDTH